MMSDIAPEADRNVRATHVACRSRDRVDSERRRRRTWVREINSYNIREARPQAGGVRDNNHNSSTFRPRTYIYHTLVRNGLSKDRAGHFLHALMCTPQTNIGLLIGAEMGLRNGIKVKQKGRRLEKNCLTSAMELEDRWSLSVS